MIMQILNIDNPKPRKYASKNEAIKEISKEIKRSWAKKNLKKFLDDSNIRHQYNI